MTLSDKFLAWLQSFLATKKQADVAKLLGVTPQRLNQWLNQDKKNIRLDAFEEIASAYRPRQPAWTLLREIEQYALTQQRPVDTAEDRAERSWHRFFGGNPRKAERLIQSLETQELLGLTDLISEVVHAIIAEGPKDARDTVSDLLRDAGRLYKIDRGGRAALKEYLAAVEPLSIKTPPH